MVRISDTKADATGRSSGKLIGKRARYSKPPKGEAWSWFTRSIMESPAWRALGINERRVLDRLMIEHMAHAGSENGNLICTHDDFRRYGIRGNSVRASIDRLELFGFIRCQRGGRWAGKNTPSIYRLTWIGDRKGAAPTNEWEKVTEEQIKLWTRQRRDAQKSALSGIKKQGSLNKSDSTVLSFSLVPSGKNG